MAQRRYSMVFAQLPFGSLFISCPRLVPSPSPNVLLRKQFQSFPSPILPVCAALDVLPHGSVTCFQYLYGMVSTYLAYLALSIMWTVRFVEIRGKKACPNLLPCSLTSISRQSSRGYGSYVTYFPDGGLFLSQLHYAETSLQRKCQGYSHLRQQPYCPNGLKGHS